MEGTQVAHVLQRNQAGTNCEYNLRYVSTQCRDGGTGEDAAPCSAAGISDCQCDGSSVHCTQNIWGVPEELYTPEGTTCALKSQDWMRMFCPWLKQELHPTQTDLL